MSNFNVAKNRRPNAHRNAETKPCFRVHPVSVIFDLWLIMKPESAHFSPVGKGDTGAFPFNIQFLTLGTFSRIREKRVACPVRPLGFAPAIIEREQHGSKEEGRLIQHRLVGKTQICDPLCMGVARQQCCKWPHPAVPLAGFCLSDFPNCRASDSSLLPKFLCACNIKNGLE